MSTSYHIDPSCLPSEDDVCRYEETGYYVTKAVVPHDLLDRCAVAIAEHHRGRRDHELPKARYTDWKPGDGDGVRNNEFCSLQNDGVKELAMFPVIGAIAARLARSPSIRLFDDQAIYKPTDQGSNGISTVGWHTDHSYWSTCTSNKMLTAWIPLHDTSVANGTLTVVEGSHLWQESEHVRQFNNVDLESLGRWIGREIPDSAIKPIVLKKGQFSFHHMRSLHASAPNTAPYPRIALAVHLQDEDNRYQPFSSADGQPIVLAHDQLCRRDENGMPDYSDPGVFPTLWSERAVTA